MWYISSMSRLHMAVVSLKPVILLDSFLQPLCQARTDTLERRKEAAHFH